MKIVPMSGSLRENVGKKDAKSLRKTDLVPCVMYGDGNQIHFSVDAKSFKSIVFTPEVCFVDITIDGNVYRTMLQDIQYHPVSDNILHADFLKLDDKKTIVMSVPVKVKGVSEGVLKGGKLDLRLRKLKVKALPNNMPEQIDVDITGLDIAQGKKVGDLAMANVELLDVKTSFVVYVKPTRGSAAASAE